ncbi:MAG: KaiC domain-containing protein [Halobellus sp.]
MSDDDWFERALGEDDERGEPDEGASESDSEAEAAEAGESVAADESGPDSDAFERDEPREPDEPAGAGGSPTPTDPSGPDRDRRGADRRTDPTRGADSGESPFEEGFASALGDAPEPDTGESSGGGSPFGGAQGPGSGGFEGDFDAGDDFGFADFEGEPEGFDVDEDAFESELDRLDIGIDGLDDMILGGVPRRSLMVAIGSAGTGKTTFGLQFLNHGLEDGEDAVYISLEESKRRLLDTAAEKGWEFERYVEEDRLAVVDIDPIEMANSLDSIQSDLPELISEFGADRLVLDSVSLLEMMYESAPQRRSQVFGFTRALKRAGITTLMTSEANPENAYVSRFGIVEYLADAVFVLQYVRPSDFRETRLAVEIQKIRDANHSRETKPYELTGAGLSVYRQANIF